ncbi:hypothetical protein DRQ20_01515 [bacterium]|nr:MAG: hypothetical protein DRQ20_01515 [bacterium]
MTGGEEGNILLIRNREVKMKKWPYLIFLIFTGCMPVYYSGRVLNKGEKEIGAGIGAPLYIRRGFGDGWDAGVDVGLFSIGLDIRKRVIKRGNNELAVAGGAGIVAFPILISGVSSSFMLSVRFDRLTLAGGYGYSRYDYPENETQTFPKDLNHYAHGIFSHAGVESRIYRHFHIYPFVGYYYMKDDLGYSFSRFFLGMGFFFRSVREEK